PESKRRAAACPPLGPVWVLVEAAAFGGHAAEPVATTPRDVGSRRKRRRGRFGNDGSNWMRRDELVVAPGARPLENDPGSPVPRTNDSHAEGLSGVLAPVGVGRG